MRYINRRLTYLLPYYLHLGEDRRMQFQVIVVTEQQTDQQTHPQTHRQDRLQYTMPQLASTQCNEASQF